MSVEGMAKTTIADGVIMKDRIYFDQKAMLEQLGFTFPDVVFLAPKLVREKIRGAI
jgi:hypothetical protein